MGRVMKIGVGIVFIFLSFSIAACRGPAAPVKVAPTGKGVFEDVVEKFVDPSGRSDKQRASEYAVIYAKKHSDTGFVLAFERAGGACDRSVTVVCRKRVSWGLNMTNTMAQCAGTQVGSICQVSTEVVFKFDENSIDDLIVEFL